MLSMLAVMGCAGSASDNGVEVINNSDIEEEADLTEIACDFRVYPLKSDRPMDGIGGIKCWGDVMLARTNDDKKILRFDNYKLTAVLDKLGRGPGEYTYIEDFSYDADRNMLYIENDSLLVTYDASTMAFIRKQKVNLYIQNVLNLGDRMLYFGSYLDDYNRSRDVNEEGIRQLNDQIMILADKGDYNFENPIELYREDYVNRQYYGYPELFFVNPENLSTCLTGYENSIVTFYGDSLHQVYRFRLGMVEESPFITEYKGRKELEANEIQEFSRSYIESVYVNEKPYLRNVFNIMVDGNTVSFRMLYFPHGMLNESEYLYCIHNKKETKVYRHLRIPGLSQDINPTGANGNRQIALVENLGSAAIDKSVPMSPLAQQIIDELKKQNDDNPVLIEFRFK